MCYPAAQRDIQTVHNSYERPDSFFIRFFLFLSLHVVYVFLKQSARPLGKHLSVIQAITHRPE